MIAGFTGHQNLGDEATRSWVRHALRQQTVIHAVTRGLTCLAAGADQLFADLLIDMGIEYATVLPCHGYETAFSDNTSLATFRRLLGRSELIHRLAYAAPSEEAFFAASKWIVDHCDIMIAVWNGLPARGLGGTGDVVAFATSKQRRLVHVNPINRVVREVR